MGGAVEDVYCLAPRLKRTETTRGAGNMHFQILMRNSEGSSSKIVKEGEDSIAIDVEWWRLRRCLFAMKERRS